MNRPLRANSVRTPPQSPVTWVRCQKSPRTVPGSPNTGALLKKVSRPGATLTRESLSVGTGPQGSAGALAFFFLGAAGCSGGEAMWPKLPSPSSAKALVPEINRPPAGTKVVAQTDRTKPAAYFVILPFILRPI